jgi:ArsR family metal-binding transcriptional regulator
MMTLKYIQSVKEYKRFETNIRAIQVIILIQYASNWSWFLIRKTDNIYIIYESGEVLINCTDYVKEFFVNLSSKRYFLQH